MEAFNAGGILAAIPLFGETLDKRQLAHLAAQCHLVIYPPRSVLLAEGDFGDAMYAIVNGEVTVSLQDKHGGEHGVASLGVGEIVGEMSLLTGMRRNATAVARTEVSALEISKVTFEEMFSRAPDLIDRFSGVLASRQTELDRIAAGADASADAIGARIRRFFSRR
ncbi:cyclic nucleotide-binding domain-containing protein [Bauldia litoralis]|uniref:Cyclic nucleotide-binding domain-containing protein n=1 Tax=Bauldia litoralis TaxID=665467 RepID=A0A1G6AF84_9HYPH|nr:cyclic nucleotide-binding domain-containing protein [Bauldia litoralis]SDB07055.1 Cyclic nucleotide-binding domain-containing protein [Bauldia litoralis]